jgi:hypothetical protein
MKSVVFYSWQSDLPNATNRSFIQQALENVARAITADKTIEVEAAIDRDTQGVPGAPDIAKTILEKIGTSDVVVADVSIIGGTPDGRRTPNPNVLIELGYALCSLGPERVLLVLNTAYGRPELLPFDLKMRRVVTYNMPESVSDRAGERKSLEAKLNEAVRAGLTRGRLKAEQERKLEILFEPKYPYDDRRMAGSTQSEDYRLFRVGVRNIGINTVASPKVQISDVTPRPAGLFTPVPLAAMHDRPDLKTTELDPNKDWYWDVVDQLADGTIRIVHTVQGGKQAIPADRYIVTIDASGRDVPGTSRRFAISVPTPRQGNQDLQFTPVE